MAEFSWILRRFFLHVMVDEVITIHDPEGHEFFSLSAAEDEAREIIRELTVDSIQTKGRVELDRSLRIVDEAGRIMSELSFRAALDPAHV
jgi:hypothetical protein